MGQDAYIIVVNQYDEKLAADVNMRMAEGYRPVGGVAARPGSTQTGYMLYQTMVLSTPSHE